MNSKLLYFGLILVLIINCFPTFAVFADNGDVTSDLYTAEAILGTELESKGFSLIESGNLNTPNVVKRSGSYCWLLDKTKGKDLAYINFALSDSFKNERDGSVYEIEVEYFDAGEGYFNLAYDSVGETSKYADFVYMNNTLIWKTAHFTIDDAQFANEIDGKYDFRLSITTVSTSNKISASSVPIRKVIVKKKRAVNPIFVSSYTEVSGNAYKWYDKSKVIYNKFENLTNEPKTVNVTYRLMSKEGFEAFSKTEILTFEPGEVKNNQFEFGELNECDSYWYCVDICDSEGTINSEFKLLELAVLKTDPDGIRNKGVYWATHIGTAYKPEVYQTGGDVLALSNAGGTRAEILWRMVETSKGSFKWEGTSMQKHFTTLNNYGMDTLVLLQGMPLWYKNYLSIPAEADEIEGWRAYVKFVATTLKDYDCCYEIWNEPNITSFNKLVSERGGDVYMKMYNIAVEEIKKVSPNAKIGGPSVTGIIYDSAQKFYKESLEAGLWKNADAIVLHPYSLKPIENGPEVKAIEQYRDDFVKKGGKDPELWHTEVGYTNADKYINGSEKLKAALLIRTFIHYTSHNLSDKIVYYVFEKKGLVDTDREDQFGFVSPGKSETKKYGTYFIPTEAYVMMTAMNYVMAQSEIESVHDRGDGKLFISKYKSEKFGKDLLTLYTFDEPELVTLNLGAEKVTLFDEYGNETEVYGKDGIFSFIADENPRYIIGDIDTVKIIDNSEFIGYDKVKYVSAVNDVFTITLKNGTQNNYTVEAELPDDIKLVDNNGFENGTAKLVLENKCNKGETSFVKIAVKNGDKVVHHGKIKITSDDHAYSEMEVSLDNPKNTDLWNGKLTITNNSATRTLTGFAKFTTPDCFIDAGMLDIGIIPPNCVGEVNFTLPKVTKKGKYTPQYSILLDNGDEYSFSNSVDFTLAKYAYNKPKIDGIIDKNEWDMSTVMYADSAEQIVKLADWTGPDDLSGKSAVMWDEDNFYMTAIVKDDYHVNNQPPNSNWNGDNMQFGIFYGEEEFIALGQGGTSFHEISMALSSLTNDVSVWRYSSQDNCYPAGEFTDAECVIKRNGRETVYEFKVPWNKMLRPGDKVKEGERLGYSFLFNEADSDLREGWIEYASGIGESKDTSLFTYMILLK